MPIVLLDITKITIRKDLLYRRVFKYHSAISYEPQKCAQVKELSFSRTLFYACQKIIFTQSSIKQIFQYILSMNYCIIQMKYNTYTFCCLLLGWEKSCTSVAEFTTFQYNKTLCARFVFLFYK